MQFSREVFHELEKKKWADADVHTIKDGRWSDDTSSKLEFKRMGFWEIRVVNKSTSQVKAKLARVFCELYLNQIEELACPWDGGEGHRMVIKDAAWRKLYHYALREVPYVRQYDEEDAEEMTVPCMGCGIVLREDLIEVDHQRPVHRPDEAVAKVLRALELTTERSVGYKASMFTGAGLWHSSAFHSIPTRRGRTKTHLGRGPRYTLNSDGTILVSLVIAAGKQQRLERLCLNSKLNLAPLCKTCNSVNKKGTLKFLF